MVETIHNSRCLWGVEMELTEKWNEGVFWNDAHVLYLDEGWVAQIYGFAKIQ